MGFRNLGRFWLIFGAAVLVVILIVTAWLVSLEISEGEVHDRYNRQQLLLLEGAAAGMEGLFEDLAAGMRTLGAQAAVQSLDEEAARSELDHKLEELAPKGMSDLAVLDASGTARFFARDTEFEGVDYAWRSYFKEAQAMAAEDAAEDIIVELQTVRVGELGFVLAVPFYTPSPEDAESQGSFAGVLLGMLTLDALVQRHLAPFEPPGQGSIFLVDQDLDIIWSSDEGMEGSAEMRSRQGPFAEMSGAIIGWQAGQEGGEFYTDNSIIFGADAALVAFAPVHFGEKVLSVGVVTPGSVARQSSFAAFRSQQLVFVLSIVTILLGVLAGAYVLNREVRRRSEAEEALRSSEREQAVLAERNRLAGDLHDSVTQGLYGILLHADAAMSQLAVGRTEKARSYLEAIKDAGKEGLAEMRMLIFELRPPVLEQEGLAAALEMRLHAVERRAGLKVEMETDIEGRLPVEVEAGLYRIAQESLNNTLKHAAAGEVRVRLCRQGAVVRLEIRDDGRGFDQQAVQDGGGMGLAGMRERARNMNADLSVESRPGSGTVIRVEVEP